MLFLGDLCPSLLFTPTPLFAPSSNSPLQGLVEDDEGPAPLPFPPPPAVWLDLSGVLQFPWGPGRREV